MPINYPEIQQHSHLELIARQVVEGFITGLHKSPYHGFSVEFAEHRQYNSGESTRNIDWKLFGRTERLYVKKFEEETNLRCQLVIDNSSSMHYPDASQLTKGNENKIQFSIYAAAALMYMLKRQQDAFGLSVFSDKIEVNTQAKSTTAHQKLLNLELESILEQTNINNLRKTAAAKSLHEIAESIHKRSLVVIFSDMFDNDVRQEDLFAAMQHLKHNKHEVILFHVTDKSTEEDFTFENRPYIFIDKESGEQVKTNYSNVKNHYVESMRKYKQDLLFRCRQYGIDFVEADIKEGYKQILLPYLVKRQHML